MTREPPGAPRARAAVADLRGTLKRFAPLDRDTKPFATLLATRQANIRRAIHNLNLVTNAFGGVEGQLASLIRASDTNFSAIAANDTQLQQTLTEFPPTLRQSIVTLDKVRGFANASTTTLHAAPALRAQPGARAQGVAAAVPRHDAGHRQPAASVQRRRPAAGAHAGGGRAQAQGHHPVAHELDLGPQHAVQRARPPARRGQQSYLFWGSWLAHIADSLVSAQDANGAVLQGIFMGTCDELNFFENQLEPNQSRSA